MRYFILLYSLMVLLPLAAQQDGDGMRCPYRVKFAQQMLSSSPDIKLTEVWTAAGFSSESSFYRIFKSITDTTPNDWKTTNS